MLLSPLAETQRSRPPRRVGRFVNVAHRGASAAAPENTLSAIRRAIALGADLIELDVQRSKDGALVLMHDATVVRTTDARRALPHRGPWRVADLTHQELMRLDAGSWKSPEFAGEAVPTLEQALGVVQGSGAGLLLELKAPRLHPGIVRDLVTTLTGTEGYLEPALTRGELVVQSFDVAAMKEHKTRAPAIPVGLLGAPAAANLPALATWADQVNPGRHSLDRAYVDRVHAVGLECLVWTVDRRLAMKRAIAMDVDGVITNRPDVLAQLSTRTGSGRPAAAVSS